MIPGTCFAHFKDTRTQCALCIHVGFSKVKTHKTALHLLVYALYKMTENKPENKNFEIYL